MVKVNKAFKVIVIVVAMVLILFSATSCNLFRVNNLKNSINEAVRENSNLGADKKITKDDYEKLKNLDADGKEIADLNEIKLLISLENLNLSDNNNNLDFLKDAMENFTHSTSSLE